jgi:hypothetical protein
MRRPWWLCIVATLCLCTLPSAAQPADWRRPELVDPRTVQLGGPLGQMFDRSLARIARPPYESVSFVRSDVSFEHKRWFTNYSGDCSGRFIELASLTSPPGKKEPAILADLLESITRYQKGDGHYGAEVDWPASLDNAEVLRNKVMPIFWGNGRLLIGLLAAYEQYKAERLLASAKKLGDFYIATADIFCDPAKEQKYRGTATYAEGYVTCYFEGMEGLTALSRITGDKKYLGQADRMADFFEKFDKLPLDHSHGNLSAQLAMLYLYEATGKPEYLTRVAARWDQAVRGGYVNAIGGIGEKFITRPERDEGCSECDWLRVNLELWRATGQTKYLDMAERLLWNHYRVNQFPSGGFGHRRLFCDDKGVVAIGRYDQEAEWCCVFHGALGLNALRSYLAVGTADAIYLNFFVDFTAPVVVGDRPCTVSVKTVEPKAGEVARVRVDLQGNVGRTKVMFRRTAWGTEPGADRTGGYFSATLIPGKPVMVAFRGSLAIEDRRFTHVTPKPGRLDAIVFRQGPKVLFAQGFKDKPRILVAVDADGQPVLSQADAGRIASVVLPPGELTDLNIAAALAEPRVVTLGPWETIRAKDEIAFVFDAVVVPVASPNGQRLLKVLAK